MNTDPTSIAAEIEQALLKAGQTAASTEFDYIIVGSGAGGGPLACRLALAGKRVLLIEAGGDPGAKEVHQVPGYHGAATEDPEMSWSNSVSHYADEPGRDLKYAPDRDPSNLDRYNRDPATGQPCNPSLPGASESQRGRGRGGINYPRSSGIGGCTGHHAMIVIRPNDSDWDYIAQETGDPSWTGAAMQPYFARFERCLYRREYRDYIGRLFGGLGRWLQKILTAINPKAVLDEAGHGRNGWQPTTLIGPSLIREILEKDPRFTKVLIGTLLSVSDNKHAKRDDRNTLEAWLRDGIAFVKRLAISFGVVNTFDPNDLNRRRKPWGGAYLIPVGIESENPPVHPNALDENDKPMAGKRAGLREFILRTQKQCNTQSGKGRLVIQKATFVKKLIFSTDTSKGARFRAIGVDCVEGAHLYDASPLHQVEKPEPSTALQFFTRGEVILCGGSFNTPQLLMLSGIGDHKHLEAVGMDAKDLRVHLPGVGRNLQDRYEVCVVSEMKEDFSTLEKVSFTPEDKDDPARKEWIKSKSGLYGTNGGSLAIIRRSDYAEGHDPDLFTFGAPAAFRGYYWNWSKELLCRTKGEQKKRPNLWTWVILKAYTRNSNAADGKDSEKAGAVRLRDLRWHVPPDIQFNSFAASGCEGWEKDVMAIQQAIEEVRSINDRVRSKHKDLFIDEIQPDARLDNSRDPHSPLGKWIQNEAWGHHACGTCRIGKDKWSPDPAQNKLKDAMAVVDSEFRVHGVEGLRVVDASVFPKIPGYFILAPIFMVSEKAADTLLQSDQDGTYPLEVRQFEAEAVRRRRHVANVPPNGMPANAAAETAPDGEQERAIFQAEESAEEAALADPSQLPPRTIGLALSGGGIRSATFALGVLQHLAATNRLRSIDFMSTVSGGGYVGSFLGRLFTRPTIQRADDPAGRVQEVLANTDSAPIRWLRRHGNYLVSAGTDDAWQALGIFYRNLLTVYLIVGALLFTLFGLLVGVGRWPLLVSLAAKLPGLPKEEGKLSDFDVLWSVWWWLPVAVGVLVLLPCTLGYWLAPKVGSTRPYPPFALAAWLILLGGSAVALSLPGGFPYGAGGILLLSLAWLWQEIARTAPEAAPASAEAMKEGRVLGSLVRNRMTRMLEVALKLFALAVFWVAFDTLAVNIAVQGFSATMAKIALAVTPLTALMRNSVLKGILPGGGGSGLSQQLCKVTGILLMLLLLLTVDVFAHELGRFDDARWLWVTLIFAGLFSAILGHAFDVLNLTSLHSAYASRILRTFQGATNEARVFAGDSSPYRDVQIVHPYDDTPHHLYRPEEKGGPLHLINVCVNETVDHTSLRQVPDRRGLPMAIGSFGISVGDYFATWTTSGDLPWWRRLTQWLDGIRPDQREPVALKALSLNDDPGTFHPLGRRDGTPAVPEKLTLGAWIAISGAAFSTGIGRRTSIFTASLRGLLNIRLGYWWNSGITAGERPGRFPGNLWRQITGFSGFIFRSQQLLLAEWRARFRGPSMPLWNLSDGGHQEVTGLYELLRRRVKFMIVTDAGEDPSYQFEDFGELQRQALMDFNATITWLDTTQPNTWSSVPDWIRAWIVQGATGTPSKIKRLDSHCASLARVVYGSDKSDPSYILLLKPCMAGTTSLALCSYSNLFSAFPQQSTTDQLFDDVQWESYRSLGQHIASKVIQ